MAKFKSGETSSHVVEKKKAITNAIIIKSKLIREMESIEEVPKALKGKNGKISEGAVHRWQDNKIGALSYSRNTAYAHHNQYALEQLISAINDANNRISNPIKAKSFSNSPLRERIKELEQENNSLRNALAEVYRAYMYIKEKNTEQANIQLSKQEFISEQAATLGINRLKAINKND